jgi:hypothetical protein
MFKIIAIICTVTYGGHVIDCTRMEETDKRTFTTYEACVEEAGYKHKQLADILTRPEFSEDRFTLRVYCEAQSNSI